MYNNDELDENVMLGIDQISDEEFTENKETQSIKDTVNSKLEPCHRHEVPIDHKFHDQIHNKIKIVKKVTFALPKYEEFIQSEDTTSILKDNINLKPSQNHRLESKVVVIDEKTQMQIQNKIKVKKKENFLIPEFAERARYQKRDRSREDKIEINDSLQSRKNFKAPEKSTRNRDFNRQTYYRQKFNNKNQNENGFLNVQYQSQNTYTFLTSQTSQIHYQNSFNQSQLTLCHNQFQFGNDLYHSFPNFDHPQFSQGIFDQPMYNPNDMSFQPSVPINPTFNYPINFNPQQIKLKPSCVYINPLFIARNELTDINQNSGANDGLKQDTSKEMTIQNNDAKDLKVLVPIKASVKQRITKIASRA